MLENETPGGSTLVSRARAIVVAAAVVAMLVALLGPASSQPAWAGPGSRIGGFVWSDVNRDGARTADETLKAGVTVELLSGPTGPVSAWPGRGARCEPARATRCSTRTRRWRRGGRASARPRRVTTALHWEASRRSRRSSGRTS